MSSAGQIQAQIDAAVAAAVAPLLTEIAALTGRVTVLEDRLTPSSRGTKTSPTVAERAAKARPSTASGAGNATSAA